MRILLALLLLSTIASAQAIDSDHDGLEDVFEQQLLERFRPSFFVAADDCDVLPSEFALNEAKPRALKQSGKIYGQVAPLEHSDALLIELRYFHLWASDCGRMSHDYDPERVAALLRATKDDWQAIAWYSAAHEGTVCDVSDTRRAEELGATNSGPAVWISSGKHASFLRLERCTGGCSYDRCEQMTNLPVLPLVNIGEPGAPMNGALWIDSKAWLLPEKTKTAFDAPMVASLLDPAAPLPEPPHRTNAQAVVTAGNYGLGGVEIGTNHTDSALQTGQAHAEQALSTADKKAKSGVKRALEKVKGWFGRKKDAETDVTK